MAKVAKTRDNPLVPSPKVLDRALEQSAATARRMADAFGLKVPAATGGRSTVKVPIKLG